MKKTKKEKMKMKKNKRKATTKLNEVRDNAKANIAKSNQSGIETENSKGKSASARTIWNRKKQNFTNLKQQQQKRKKKNLF